mmetsp:Transcript_87008/g.221584  ORF Transcript_87008/g.221584 Transcript_87008/m.221584 type:complete len:290 (+) Transcript_87008:899-1768(+)
MPQTFRHRSRGIEREHPVHALHQQQDPRQTAHGEASAGSASAHRGRSVVRKISRLRDCESGRELFLVLEDTLDTLVAALHVARSDVVLARALTRPQVCGGVAFLTTELGSREVRVASHLPDRLHAIVRMRWVWIVPPLKPQACQVVVEHRQGRSVLLPHQGVVIRDIQHGQRRVVGHGAVAELHGLAHRTQGGALPSGVFQAMQILHPWEDRIDAIALPADGIRGENLFGSGMLDQAHQKQLSTANRAARQRRRHAGRVCNSCTPFAAISEVRERLPHTGGRFEPPRGT